MVSALLRLVCISGQWLPFLLVPRSCTWEGHVVLFLPLRRRDRVVRLHLCYRLLPGCILVALITHQPVRLVILEDDVSQSRILITPVLLLLPFAIFSAVVASTVD